MTMDHVNNDWLDGLERIELYVSEIKERMNQNMLKLNGDKTELTVFTSKYKQDLYNDLSIMIGGTVVDCSLQVRDLGVIFDRVLSLRQHVSYTSTTCRFHFRNICRIRKCITSWHKCCPYQVIDNTILMVCCMDSVNVLFLACKQFKTQMHVL